jgi:hypothetical protein
VLIWTSVGNQGGEKYYPGDDYIDYTGYSLYEQADASKLWCGHERSFAQWMDERYPAFAKQQPYWIDYLHGNEQREEVAKWIREFGQRYPDTQFIDVLNEPIHAPPSYKDGLGGDGSTAWDWVIWSFETAPKYCSHAKTLA